MNVQSHLRHIELKRPKEIPIAYWLAGAFLCTSVDFDKRWSLIACQLESLLRGCPALPVSDVQVMAQLQYRPLRLGSSKWFFIIYPWHLLQIILQPHFKLVSFVYFLQTTNESFVFILKVEGDILRFSIDDSKHVCLQLHQRGEYECSSEEDESREEKDTLMGS